MNCCLSVILRFIIVILSEAKDLRRPCERSFASLRMTDVLDHASLETTRRYLELLTGTIDHGVLLLYEKFGYL